MEESKISVLIVDDHPFFRKGIRLFLEDNEEIELVREVADGKEALKYLDKNSDCIDVIIMDLQMPRMDGEEATRVICNKWPNIKILVLTSYGSGDKVYSLLSSGAAGYLLKEAEPDELVLAIKAVYAGGTYFGKEVIKELLNMIPEKRKQEDIFQDLIEPLTKREIEVLKLIGEGMGNCEIANNLHISNNTVKTHVANIFQKLGVNSRTQAAFYAMKQGMI